MTRKRLLAGILVTTGLAAALTPSLQTGAGASSHREAPLITEDPVADLTDVYAFNSPDAPGTVTLVMNVNPFELPAGGPNFHKFGDDVLYQLNIDNDGDAVADKEYEFRFHTTITNPNTFLYNTGPLSAADQSKLSVKQTYSVSEVDVDQKVRHTLATNLPVAPANVGVRSTPDYEQQLGLPAVQSIAGGIKVFAGPRDDPFFVDLGSIFDLGGLRPLNQFHVIPLQNEAGKDYVAGYNVHSIVLQVPASRLTANGDPVIGVWATTYRHQVRVFDGTQSPILRHLGPWVQVARLGMPLVNEAVIPLGQKDTFNASPPKNDAQFLDAVIHPELVKLMPVLYGSAIPDVPQSFDAGLGLGGREDIATIFLTGLPGLNKPAHLTRPSEQLRLNTSTPSAQQHFPNGRQLADDVTDTELQALAGVFAGKNVFPYNALTDGVNANDVPFTTTFPYLATPHDGYTSS
jgi:hypothetical protein